MLLYIIIGIILLAMIAVTTYAMVKNQELKSNALAAENEAERRCAAAEASVLNAKRDADKRCANYAAKVEKRLMTRSQNSKSSDIFRMS